MRKVIGGLCCFIVALQVLIGVPLLVCTAFFCLVQGSEGPIVLEVHTGPRPPATISPSDYPPPQPLAALAPAVMAPPRNVIPTDKSASNHPILQTRAAQGSPLTGTVLASPDGACEEQQQFLAALEKAAAACVSSACDHQVAFVNADQAACPEGACPEACLTTVSAQPPSDSVPQLRSHLYQMADLDEQSGHYERADQWRAMARDLQPAGHKP